MQRKIDKTEGGRQGEREGSGPAEAAVRLKANRKMLGNTQEITVVHPPLHSTLSYVFFFGDLINSLAP